ncbi:alpha-amylase A-like [Watersipora subatra]|uniref:alpha-amylase A-like n=1 Tax=Watersipora subatra TaxID=2589382 RepID=UPI00355B959F
MVTRCNAAGVRVYIDAVINHMVAADAGSGVGSAGSQYDTSVKSFTGVPYGPKDFTKTCKTASGGIENDNDPNELRNCKLLGLMDLDGSSKYVRQKIVDYFDDMLNIGIDGSKMAEVFLAKGQKLSSLSNVFSWMMLSGDDALVFIDNHDNQRSHGAGKNIITFKQPREYKMATAFMLSWPYGVPRIMSSFDFTQDWTGPPSSSPNMTGSCGNGWICEHRWRQIANMVEWRNQAGKAPVENWWSNGDNQIAYSRGKAAFIAFNNEDGNMSMSLFTSLPPGQYCDIISGDLLNGICTGKTIRVGYHSEAEIDIDGSSQDPIIAFHLGSKVSELPVISTDVPGFRMTTKLPPSQKKRTIVFIRKITGYGEKIFIRGATNRFVSIPITYNYIKPKTEERKAWYHAYSIWSQGDTELSWGGAENGQGMLQNGEKALGSPMIWTSSNSASKEYFSENRFGDHYWMWDVMMDCSKLPGGYFEFKGYSSKDGSEKNVRQEKCLGETTSYRNIGRNHVAKCGYKTVVEWQRVLRVAISVATPVAIHVTIIRVTPVAIPSVIPVDTPAVNLKSLYSHPCSCVIL